MIIHPLHTNQLLFPFFSNDFWAVKGLIRGPSLIENFLSLRRDGVWHIPISGDKWTNFQIPTLQGRVWRSPRHSHSQGEMDKVSYTHSWGSGQSSGHLDARRELGNISDNYTLGVVSKVLDTHTLGRVGFSQNLHKVVFNTSFQKAPEISIPWRNYMHKTQVPITNDNGPTEILGNIPFTAYKPTGCTNYDQINFAAQIWKLGVWSKQSGVNSFISRQGFHVNCR